MVDRVTLARDARRHPVACGLDIGSTNTKAVALSPEGFVVARASRPTPRDQQGLSIDVPTLLDSVDDMLAEICGNRYRIHAICTAGIGEDGVLVDKTLSALAPPLAWFDPRRQGIFTTLRPDLQNDETFDADIDPARAIVGWAWSRAQPGTQHALAWIALTDLASVRWTRRPFLSDTLASRTGAWRSTDRSWAADRVDLTLGSTDLLPEVLAAGDIVCEVSSPDEQSAHLFARDAVVVAGGHDHPIGGWGVDQLVPGAILDSMGTAEVVVVQAPRPLAPRLPSVDWAPGIRSSGTTVLRVEELTRNVAWAAQDPAVGVEIQGILTGSVEPLAVLDTGYFIPGHRGGGRPAYAADAPHDPRARASAVLGALAGIGRDAVLALQQSVTSSREVRLAGGWSRYPGWLEIKATVSGFTAVPIAEPEVTAVGAALLAATARGWKPEPENALGGSRADDQSARSTAR